MNNLKATAAVLEKKRKLNFFKINIPQPKENQTIIKFIYSGICGSQFMEYNGNRGKDKWLPHMLGHEAVGEVISVGKKVNKFKPRDKVIVSWLKNKNDKKKDVSGKIKLKSKDINYGPVTTFSTISLISANRIYKLPSYIPTKQATLFGCSIPTGAGVVMNEAKPSKNSFCAVVGVGAVGVFSLIALKGLGIKNIIAIDSNIKRLNLISKLGFKNTISSNDKNLLSKINNITSYNKLDYCFECSGNANVISKCIKLISNSGRLFFVSHPKFNDYIKINPYDLILGKKIFGSWGGSTNLNKDIKKFYNIIKKSKINLNHLIDEIKFSKLKDVFKKKNNNIKPKLIIKF